MRRQAHPWPSGNALSLARAAWELLRPLLWESAGPLGGGRVQGVSAMAPDQRARRQLLAGLERITRGETPVQGVVRVPLLLKLDGGRASFGLGPADDGHQLVRFALAVLSDRSVRRLVKRCDNCTTFFLALRETKRYCSDDCRRKWANAHRDPQKHADYMREYRLNERAAVQLKQRRRA